VIDNCLAIGRVAVVILLIHGNGGVVEEVVDVVINQLLDFFCCEVDIHFSIAPSTTCQGYKD